MYFIKKITVDDKQNYQSSKVVDNTKKTIASALNLLQNSVRAFIKEEYGREASEQIKILDIHKIDQVNEPIVDCILLYRLVDDPHRVLVYQKKTVLVKATNWTWGTTDTLVPQFRRTHIFELEEYEKTLDKSVPQNNQIQSKAEMEDTIIDDTIVSVEMVQVGSSKVKIPKPMTVAPMCDLIAELKKSERFKKLFNKINSSPAPESAPKPTIVRQPKIIIRPFSKSSAVAEPESIKPESVEQTKVEFTDPELKQLDELQEISSVIIEQYPDITTTQTIN